MSDAQRPQEPVFSYPLLLTPEEAATALRVGRTTIYALMKAGDLQPVHIGRSCRLSPSELERYVNQLDAPPSDVPPRSGARRRTTKDQRGLFDLTPLPPDAA